jgi:transposase
MMSNERFAAEFKSEAVRQVVERGYTVADVAKRLGVSAQSLYKWVRVSSPSDDQKDKAELLEVRRENLRLRADLARAQEERDILKKAAAYFARQSE